MNLARPRLHLPPLRAAGLPPPILPIPLPEHRTPQDRRK